MSLVRNATLAAVLVTVVSCLTPPGLRAPASADATGASAAPPAAPPPVARPAPARVPGLPETFAWTSTGPLIVPKPDATHDLVAVKDPTVVRYNDRWHVYASSVAKGGIYGMVYTSFADWGDAPKAPPYYMDKTRGFNTYVAAPQLFYFTPQNKWYLVFQSGPPMYATADDPADATQWTEPKRFFPRTPKIVDQNGGWLDFWVICDAQLCHLFFSDDKGRWYKSKTAIDQFPYGFSDPIVVMQDAEAGRLFEACNVYKIGGTNKYLALIEAFDKTSNWKRYFRSWTADSLEGPWTVLHDDATSPFAGKQNVSFDGAAWSDDISHGEMIRAGHDETMTIDGGAKLQYLFQSFAPGAPTSNYNAIPWQLGLLTLK
jgi:endo-1,4-beta-xylanase